MTEHDKSGLIFLVLKPLWLATEIEPRFKIVGWTTKEPAHDNGYIESGTLLIFDYIYTDPTTKEEGLNFMMVRPGPESELHASEFTEDEIRSLTEEGALGLQDIDDVDEVSNTPKGILIKDTGRLSFNRKLLLPKDQYIVMGSRESKQSNHIIRYGEKISLQHIIDVYSIAVGKGIILK